MPLDKTLFEGRDLAFNEKSTDINRETCVLPWLLDSITKEPNSHGEDLSVDGDASVKLL